MTPGKLVACVLAFAVVVEMLRSLVAARARRKAYERAIADHYARRGGGR